MSSTQRAVAVCLALSLAAVPLLAPRPAHGQLPPPPPGGPGMPGGPGSRGGPVLDPKDPHAFEASLLPRERQEEAKRKLAAAMDRLAIPDLDSAEARIAVQSLQAILDSPGDVFIYMTRKDKDGKESTVRVSARYEANRLLSDLPKPLQEVYQTEYGGEAKRRLDDARQRRDPLILGDVVCRYLYTKAGGEALVMLASHHLDRGQPGTAAFYFQRLLQRPGAAELDPIVLFRAVVAFRQAGDREAEKEALRLLGLRLNNKPLRVGDREVPLDDLQVALTKLSGGSASSRDWTVFRGDALRSGRGQGDAPYLEPRWQAATVELAEARDVIEKALKANGEGTAPTLPGSFPIAAGGKLVCRTAAGVTAFDLRTGQKAWQTSTDPKDRESLLSLEACLRDAGKKVQLNMWLRQYSPQFVGAGSVLPGAGAPFAPGMPPGGRAPIDPSGAVLGSSSYVPAFVYENGVLGALSTDQKRVYVVDDIPLQPTQALVDRANGVLRPLGPFEDLLQFNKIVALDLDTGKKVWEAGDHPKNPKLATELSDCFFLGPPLPLFGKLYAVAEKQGEIRLVCLDPAKGDLSWVQPLVLLRSSRLPADVGRRLQALHPAYADGILVCPTAGGAVLGVDVLSRSLVWVDVYKERPPVQPDGTVDETFEPPLPLSTPWKGSAPLIADGKVIVPCPDSDLLLCVNLRDGKQLWKVNRAEDDLYVGGVFDAKNAAGKDDPRLLIVGKNACRAVSLKDGATILWSQTTGLPSGHGVASGSLYYLPLKNGQLLTLDVEKGKVVSRTDARSGAPGNLIAHEGDILSQTATSVAAYPQLKAKLAQVDELIKKNPRDPLALTERGELKLYQGNLPDAVADLREARRQQPPAELQPRLRARLFEALTQLLQESFKDGEPFLDEYRELCRVDVPPGVTPEERMRLRAEQQRRETQLLGLVAHGRQQQRRYDEALAAYRDLHAKAGSQLVRNIDDAYAQSRLDVWVESRVTSLFAEAGKDRDALERKVRQDWKALRDGNDQAARERFVALFGGTCRAGEEARLELADLLTADLDRAVFPEAERLLEQVRGQSGDRELTARAVEGLARLALRKGRLNEAAELYRSLGREFADVAVRDGQTGADVLAEVSLDKRLLGPLSEGGSPWRRGKFASDLIQGAQQPRPAPRPPGAPPPPPDQPQQVQYFTFEPSGPAPEGLRRQVLQYDWLSSNFRLLDRQTGAELWSAKSGIDFALQQYFRGNGMVGGRMSCYVVGRVAVVSLGTTIYGIDLLDHRVLWRRRLIAGQFDQSRFYLDPGAAEGGMQLFQTDPTGQGTNVLLGRVGYAGGGLVALQTATGLVVLDALRGETRWVRADVRPDDELFGDDQYLFAVTGHGAATRVFRAADGAEVQAPSFVTQYQTKEQRLGRLLLLFGNDDQGRLELRLYDIVTGKDVWKHVSPANTLLASSEDPGLTAVIEADGTARVFDLRLRKEVLKAEVDRKDFDNLAGRPYLVSDRTYFYLLPNQPLTPADRIEGQTVMSGAVNARSVPVNGELYALARVPGTPGVEDWHNTVRYQHLLLDQFEESPLLAFASLFNRQRGNNGEVEQILAVQFIEKATAKRTYGDPHSLSKSKEFPNVGQGVTGLVVDTQALTIDLVGPMGRIRHTQPAN